MVDGLKSYEDIHKYVQSTGGSNADGRISKSFFGTSISGKQSIPNAIGEVKWVKLTSADAIKLESQNLSSFSFDTSVCDGTRHSNIATSEYIPLSDTRKIVVLFQIKVVTVSRKWPVMLLLAKFMKSDKSERVEKYQLKITKTIGNITEHRIEIDAEDDDVSIRLNFHISKDSGYAGSVENIQMWEGEKSLLPPQGIRLPRPFALPGTEDLELTGMPRIDMISGCETSYISAYLQKLGFNIFHSFENHRAMDPYTELVSGQSPYLESTAEAVLLSQIQVLRPLITKFERAAGQIKQSDGEAMIDATLEALRWSISELLKVRTAKIWVMTHPGYHTPAMGMHDYRSGADGWSVYEMLTYYKMKLYSLAREFAGVYVLDIDLALERTGKIPSRENPRIRLDESLGGHVERDGADIIAENFIHQLFITSKAVKRIKCIVVDCDNTLWKGILRDDGAEAIKIHRTRFQRLWHISKRGIPIALCSKNDPDDTELILDIIKRYGRFHEAVVTTRINWLPKSENIKSIAEEINIGIDTIAFFDDNPFEREQVKEATPEVSVFEDTDILIAPELPQFITFGDLTEDSSERVVRYKEEASRKQVEVSFGEDRFEEFLMQCEMRLEARLAQASELARSAEIFQRTNQMNATLKRADLPMVERFHNTEGQNVHIVKLGDKFGSYGIIGTALTRNDGGVLFIEELALSCRAMGRRVEEALLEELIGHARDLKASTVSISVTRTSRNDQIFNALDRVGFKEAPESKKGDQSVMKIELSGSNRAGRNFAKWFAYDDNIIDED